MSEEEAGFACSVCGSSETYLNGRDQGPRCAPCKRAYARARYWADPERENARYRAWWAANRAVRKGAR
ncbi:hypothetical protein L7D48_06705 [Streptomyces sp. S1A]|uniref:hypothetical protein n=1 Tax=Streptomyces sp. ICN903 TaxID=2964654 RepID=UPI001EDB07F0|nr:hypothetical protein [Streptomyces sp. ICN903]MCG3040261.1 hypothetical protein [Streptomyces sp. ICN903]